MIFDVCNLSDKIAASLGEWSKTCRYCKERAAANLAKLV